MHDEADAFLLSDSEGSELEPISCELSNGHTIKIAAGLWSKRRTFEEWVSGTIPEPYFAIRVYCTENVLPKRLAWVEEFCEETDFCRRDFASVWRWLSRFCASREMFDFDCFQEFLHFLEEALLEYSTPDEDAVEHIEHLPELTDPKGFDKVDDSVFTDQDDSKEQH